MKQPGQRDNAGQRRECGRDKSSPDGCSIAETDALRGRRGNGQRGRLGQVALRLRLLTPRSPVPLAAACRICGRTARLPASLAPHVQYSFTNDKFRMGMLVLCLMPRNQTRCDLARRTRLICRCSKNFPPMST